MTENRSFKNIVKGFAERNPGISYSEAKKFVIKGKEISDQIGVYEERINKLKEKQTTLDDSSEELNKVREEINSIYEKMNSLSSPLLKETPSSNAIHIGNGSYIQLDEKYYTDYLKYYFDKEYFKNNMRLSRSNVIKGINFCFSSTIETRMAYSNFAKGFDKKNIFFIDDANYFSQAPKVLKYLENYDENDEPVLLGIVENTNKEEKTLHFRLHTRLLNLAKRKNIHMIGDYRVFDSSVLVDDEELAGLSMETYKNTHLVSNFAFLFNPVRYFSFDKLHGGSYHKNTRKIVLGYNDDLKPEFVSSEITFIENTYGESCVERIYNIDANKKKGVFVIADGLFKLDQHLHANKSDNFGGFGEETEQTIRLFIKINNELSSDDMLSSHRVICEYMKELKDKKGKSFEIVIESPDAMELSSYFEERNLSMKDSVTSIEKYTLVDDELYNDEKGKLKLYEIEEDSE